MNFYKRQRRGQVIHLITFGLLAVFIAVSFLFMSFFVDSLNDSVQESDQFSDGVKDRLNTTNDTLPNILDAAFAMFVVGTAVTLIASSFLVDTNPLFFFLTLPVFMVAVIGNAVFANIIDEVGSSGALAAIYAHFNLMSFLASHWVVFTIAVGFFTIIAFFGGKGFR